MPSRRLAMEPVVVSALRKNGLDHPAPGSGAIILQSFDEASVRETAKRKGGVPRILLKELDTGGRISSSRSTSMVYSPTTRTNSRVNRQGPGRGGRRGPGQCPQERALGGPAAGSMIPSCPSANDSLVCRPSVWPKAPGLRPAPSSIAVRPKAPGYAALRLRHLRP